MVSAHDLAPGWRGCLQPPIAAAGLLALPFVTTAHAAAQSLDPVPRVAVISAFEPEIKALLARTEVERHAQANDIDFTLASSVAGR